MSGERSALMSMLFGYFPPQVLHVAVRLGLPDQLAGGPRDADDLASATECDQGSLRRLLRALAALGVVEQTSAQAFALTSTGQLLRSDVPSSLRNYALLFCGEQVWQSWGDLEYSVRTGEPAWQRKYGPPFGPEFMKPDFAAVFNAAMADGTKTAAPGVAAVGGFERFAAVADIGGGHGILLATILAAHPALHGVLFDLPGALAGAPQVLQAAGVADRCAVVAGDFFEAVPRAADAYLLKSVIHDWTDERATVLLASCRRAMSPEDTLLIVEPVLSAQPSQSELFSLSYSDINMMVCTGGRERTEQEFRSLLAAAGFELRRVVPCPATGYSVLEAGLAAAP